MGRAKNQAQLLRRWQKRKAKLLTELLVLVRRCRAGGDPETVHDLRVALRRLRLCLRAGRSLLAQDVRRGFRQWAQSLARDTSGVRDLDVTLELAHTVPKKNDLVLLLVAERERLWGTARRRLRPLPAGLRTALMSAPSGHKDAAKLARRFAKLETRYAEATQTEAERFFELSEEDRHQFRRTLRWWRYLRELSLPHRQLEKDTCLTRLLAAQEAIGNRQNCRVAREALTTLKLTHQAVALSRVLDSAEQKSNEQIRVALTVFRSDAMKGPDAVAADADRTSARNRRSSSREP